MRVPGGLQLVILAACYCSAAAAACKQQQCSSSSVHAQHKGYSYSYLEWVSQSNIFKIMYLKK